MPNFAMSGTADFSAIESKLHALQSQINSLKVPPIQVATPNFGSFFAACDAAEKKATINVKSVIEPPTTMGGGFSSFLNSEKGKFANVGREMGQSLQMGMQQQFGMMGGMATSVAGALGPIGIAAGAAAVGVGVLAAASVGLAKDWQTMMAGVSKTTGIEGPALDALSSKLQEIRMQTGATAESITGAVITAGSIGIPTAELAEFAQVSLQMGSAFSMSADEAASGIAAIGNSTKPAGESWTDFANKAGSSINVLADSMRTSETQIITGMKHLSGTFGLLKPPADTIPAWQALVATIQSLGLEGDSAGEALKDASTYITRNEKGKISDLLGITGEQLQLDVRSNAPELFMRIATAIKALPLEQQGEALKAFGMSGAQGIGMLMGDIDGTTGKFKLLGGAIATSESAWKKATSLSDAYGKSQATLDAALSKLTASLAVAGTKLGTVMLPVITDIVEMMTAGVAAASNFGTAVSGVWSGLESAIVEKPGETSWAQSIEGFFGAKTPEKRTAEISAAEMGKLTASTYNDYVNAGIKAGNFDPVTGKMKEVGKEAGEAAGDVFGEGFMKAMKDAKVSEAIGALIYDAAGNVQMSGMEALTGRTVQVKDRDKNSKTYGQMIDYQTGGINSQTGAAKSIKKLSDEFDILGQKWTYLESNTDQTKTKAIVGPQGNVIDLGQATKQYTSNAAGNITTVWSDFKEVGESATESIAKTYYNELKGSIKGSASFMKTQYSGMSSDLGNVMADGIFEPMEKKQLEVYDKLLDIYKVEYPLNFGVEEAKLQADIKSALKGPWSVDVTVKSVFEDFTSVAYREKYQYENKDFFKKLSYKEADKWMDTLSYADEIIQNPDDYSAEQLRAAQDTKTYMGLAVTSISDGTVATKGIWGVSSQALLKFDDLIDAIGRLGTDLKIAVAENIRSGKAIGEYDPYAYSGAPGETKRTPIANPFVKIATKEPTIFRDFFNDVLPQFKLGGYTGDYEGPAMLHKNELVLDADETKWYSDLWSKDYESNIKITAPVSMFQSKAKAGMIPIAESGTPIRNPWTDQSILNPAYMQDLQDQYQARGSMVRPSANLQNPYVADYSQKETVIYDRWEDVKDQEIKAALQASDMMLKKTAADGKYCEAISQFAIAQEEATGLFYDDFIGSTKNYNKAISGGYLNKGQSGSKVESIWKSIDKNTEKTASSTEKSIGLFSNYAMQTLSVFKASDRIQTYGETASGSRPSIIRGMTEDIYKTADGLNTCIQYLSDFAIMQEGPLSAMLFDAAYIGSTMGYAGAGKGAKFGSENGNYFNTFPQAEPYMSEAGSRGFLEDTTKATEKTAKETNKIEKNTATSAKELQKQSQQNADAIQTYGTSRGGGMSGALNARGVFGGSMGSIQGPWYSGGAAGLDALMYGADYSGGSPSGGSASWMNEAAASIGGSGAIQWAEGGFANQATPGVFGEAGREAFVPISDRAAGLRILPQVMRELGVRQFAQGGFSDSGGTYFAKWGGNPVVSETPTIVYAPVIDARGMSIGELQMVLERDHKKLLAKVAKKDILAKRRRR